MDLESLVLQIESERSRLVRDHSLVATTSEFGDAAIEFAPEKDSFGVVDADPRLTFRDPCIDVIAGTNGAGKSSVIGAFWVTHGGQFFNPDLVTKIIEREQSVQHDEANIAAWNLGRELLERAIAEKRDFALETTLGGDTIAGILGTARQNGVRVRMWYLSLESPELHLERVRLRVSKGGHDIPEDKIWQRFESSRANLSRLQPLISDLRVFDNSEDRDPDLGLPPRLIKKL